jgi:hypothetical protein
MTVGRERAEKQIKSEPAAPQAVTPAPAARPLSLWPLLSFRQVSGPGDSSEREADRIADSIDGGGDSCSTTVADSCACPSCSPPAALQRTAGGSAPDYVSAAAVRAQLGSGSELEPSRRSGFEQRLGVPLDGVRVHTDGRAAASAHSVNALAYTLGSDIVFAAGQFAPESQSGSRLLSHELVHVAQNARGSGGTTIQRQVAPTPGATLVGAPAPGAPVPVATPAEPVSDSGPLRPNSDYYMFRNVQMTTDPDYMRGELRRLIRHYGLKGGDLWFDALQGRRSDIALPFSAFARSAGGLRVRGPLDMQRDMQEETRRNKLAPLAVPLAMLIYPQIRAEAVRFLQDFYKGLGSTLNLVLDESERRIVSERVRYGITKSNEGGFLGIKGRDTYTAKNTVAFESLKGAAEDLLHIRQRIDARTRQQQALKVSHGHYGSSISAANFPRHEELARQNIEDEKEYDKARLGAALRHPTLAAILDDASVASPTERLSRLALGETFTRPASRFSGPPGAAPMIGQVLDQRQANIDKIREMIADDAERLWSIPPIVALTRARMATATMTMGDKLVDETLADIKFSETIRTLFLGIITLALAIPTGGGSLAVAGTAAFGLSAYQAMQSIQKYQLEMALANSDLDKRAYALAAEEPSMFWVAVDVVLCVADGAAALGAFRTLKNEARAALMAKEGMEAVEAEAKLLNAAKTVPGLTDKTLGVRLLERLKQLRKRPETARALGAVGEAEAKAVVRAGEAIAKEAKTAETLVIVGGHEVKATRSGHLVICTDCAWLRDRFAKEIADNPSFLARLEASETKTAANALDDAAKQEVAALARDLEQARRARIVAEGGPGALEALSEARKTNLRKKVSPGELEGAPPVAGSGTAGHARSKHGVGAEQQANILNEPERMFSGVNENGREVDIFYKDGSVVITEAGRKESVITSYGRVSKTPSAVDPTKWARDARYVEIRPGGGAFEIIYPNRARWELGDYP